jgi:purine-binding chemotaxis protein CheW
VVSLLVFEIGGWCLAVNARSVNRIVRAVAISPLPGAPAVLEGVINVGGTVTPVLDLRLRFGLPAAPLQPDQHLMLADTLGGPVALRVDRALDLLTVAPEVIRKVADVVPGVQYASGIATLPDGVLIIHDLDQFLSIEERLEIDQLLSVAMRGEVLAAASGPTR